MARKLGQKTYSHLANLNFLPGQYEISTTGLLHHIDQGFCVDVDTKDWQEKYLINGPLSFKPFKNFVDPRKTYYGRYVEQQRDKEIYTQRIFDEIETTGYLKNLHPCALSILKKTIPVLRYVFSALQMSASYLAHLAPESRVLIPLMFQSVDELRRIQLMAYLMGLCRRNDAQFGVNAQSEFERADVWQPLRKCLEKLLVTYDFGSSFIALNAVIKPHIDFILLEEFSKMMVFYQGHLISNIFSSIKEDSLWHQQWFKTIFEEIIQEPQQKIVVESFMDEWTTPLCEAVSLIVKNLILTEISQDQT